MINRLYKQKITLGETLAKNFNDIIEKGSIAKKIHKTLGRDVDDAFEKHGLTSAGNRLFIKQNEPVASVDLNSNDSNINLSDEESDDDELLLNSFQKQKELVTNKMLGIPAPKRKQAKDSDSDYDSEENNDVCDLPTGGPSFGKKLPSGVPQSKMGIMKMNTATSQMGSNKQKPDGPFRGSSLSKMFTSKSSRMSGGPSRMASGISRLE